jgi:hypothetical protein
MWISVIDPQSAGLALRKCFLSVEIAGMSLVRIVAEYPWNLLEMVVFIGRFRFGVCVAVFAGDVQTLLDFRIFRNKKIHCEFTNKAQSLVALGEEIFKPGQKLRVPATWRPAFLPVFGGFRRRSSRPDPARLSENQAPKGNKAGMP